MREILFKGYNKEFKCWKYGSLVKYCSGKKIYYCISEPTDCDGQVVYEVDKKSIGQYTGFLDKNKKEIYEGDIVKVGDGFSNIVEFDKEMGCWIIVNTSKSLFYHKKPLWSNKNCEVTGNIYEERLLADADLVYFASGWQGSRGCKIEHEIAKHKAYAIKKNYVEKTCGRYYHTQKKKK